MRTLAWVAISMFCLVNSAAAQTSTAVAWPIDSGSKVRVLSSALGPRFRTGILESATSDSVVIRPPRAEPVTLATHGIERLDVARGTHTRKASGALLGLTLGALGGAVLAAATYSPPRCDRNTDSWCFEFFDQGATAMFGGALGGLLGAITGLIIGASPRDNWVPVSMPPR